MTRSRLFPIYFVSAKQRYDYCSRGCPTGIRRELVEPHAAQARINHGKTLAELAAAGGLSPECMVAVLEDRRLGERLPVSVTIGRLKYFVEQHFNDDYDPEARIESARRWHRIWLLGQAYFHGQARAFEAAGRFEEAQRADRRMARCGARALAAASRTAGAGRILDIRIEKSEARAPMHPVIGRTASLIADPQGHWTTTQLEIMLDEVFYAGIAIGERRYDEDEDDEW